jgi:hypothetical protein
MFSPTATQTLLPYDTLDNDVAIRILKELINNELASGSKNPTRQLT